MIRYDAMHTFIDPVNNTGLQGDKIGYYPYAMSIIRVITTLSNTTAIF